VGLAAAVLWAVAAAPAPGDAEPLDLSPSPVDFGWLLLGETSDLTVTATNVVEEPLVVDEVRLDPADPALSVVADGCVNSRLDPGESCTMILSFQPVTEVVFEAELVVTSDHGSAAVPVYGEAAEPEGAAAAPPPDFELPTEDFAPAGTEPSAGGFDPTGSQPSADGLDPSDEGDLTPPVDARSTPDIRVCEERIRRVGLSGSFVPKVTMTEGTTETVGLALAIQGTMPAEPPGAGTSPTTVVTFPSDGCAVTAELVGGGFEITPDYPREQSFVRSDHLEWSWQVTPNRSGSLELQAQVTPWLLGADGSRHAGAASTYYADIAVTARPKPHRSVGYRLNAVIGSPAGGTVVGVLVAGVSATGLVQLIRTRLGRRTKGQDSAPSRRSV
jgi:hypothetical protein